LVLNIICVTDFWRHRLLFFPQFSMGKITWTWSNRNKSGKRRDAYQTNCYRNFHSTDNLVNLLMEFVV